MRNALLALLAGGMPIGGMAAQMQNPRAPENDAKALRDIWFDKLRERLTGLFIDQRHAARHLPSELGRDDCARLRRGRTRAAGRPTSKDLQAVVDKLRRRREEAASRILGLLKDGTIAPLELSRVGSDGRRSSFSEDARKQLLARPQGPTTEDGMRYAMYMATEFMYQQLLGNNAAAIYDPRTGLRFMNDLATYEIFWHFLYLTVFHQRRADGRRQVHKKGDRVTPELFMKLLDERRDTVKELFAKLGTSTRTRTPSSCSQILKRQVVDDEAGGTLVPQPRWIKYGSRVLLSLIEQSRRRPRRDSRRRSSASRATSSWARIERAADAPSRDRARLALRAHDYVYDVFESAEGVAA